MGKRPRIKRDMGIALSDEKALASNIASVKARKITDVSAHVAFELWFDKHYLDRIQHGDDNGARLGIEEEKVQTLIGKAVPHLLYYAFVTKGFHFANQNLAPEDRALRFVFQDASADHACLNVVSEVHVINLSRMEITVITAMSINDFKLSDGQYVIELINENQSVLHVQKQKNKIVLCEYTE